MSTRVLLVEDDAPLREVIARGLEAAGIGVEAEGEGTAALRRFDREPFDAVVLDLMLPALDGFEVCRRIRERSQTPILITTAKGDPDDVIAGLDLGADDYLTKPFRPAELAARIRAVLRRAGGASLELAPLRRGDLEIDPRGFTLRRRGQLVPVSVTEFRLLFELARHPGVALSRQDLLRQVWEYDYMGRSRMVDMAVKRLRDRIEDDPHNPRLITTVRGLGYRFETQQ